MDDEQHQQQLGLGCTALRHTCAALLCVWAWAVAVPSAGCPGAGVSGGAGRLVLLSSWALHLSALFWSLAALSVWFPLTGVAQQCRPFLEILWPLVFGSSTYSAFLFFLVILPTSPWTEFDPQEHWVCRDGAAWRGPPALQLLVTHAVPCMFAYWEACEVRCPLNDAAANAARRLTAAFVCGFVLNLAVTHSTHDATDHTPRTAPHRCVWCVRLMLSALRACAGRTQSWGGYPLGERGGESDFVVLAVPFAMGMWLHCVAPEAAGKARNERAGTLWRQLVFAPVLSTSAFVMLGCVVLLLHFFAKHIALSDSIWE
jgi:hypothetical protein